MDGELHSDGPVVFTAQPSGRETVSLGRVELGEIVPLLGNHLFEASYRLRLPDCGLESWRPARTIVQARQQIREKINDWLNAADLRPNGAA